jgi:predicted adenine nucleotide alpha hydrolase (AANH) superfamily ATPase
VKKALLHICCGVCASEPIVRLMDYGYEVCGFFYNPNISPKAEYAKRLEAAKQACRFFSIELIEGLFDQQDWMKKIKGLEGEPEGGRRCQICYKLRLQATYNKALEKGFDHFASTLSISPHKNSCEINLIGSSLSAQKYLDYDFKKSDGFKKAMDFSKKQALYRQDYCGCCYSKQAKATYLLKKKHLML